MVVLLAAVLGLAGADIATVGASATALRESLDISNTQVGMLVTAASLVGALATLPFGVLADRVRRTWTLAAAIVLWGAAMLWSASVGDFEQLLFARLALGAVTAAAGPVVASLVGDYFLPSERGRIYGFILAGDLLGIGVGFAVTGNISALSWRAAFVVLAVPAFVLAALVARLREPDRGATAELPPEPGTNAHENQDGQDDGSAGPTRSGSPGRGGSSPIPSSSCATPSGCVYRRPSATCCACARICSSSPRALPATTSSRGWRRSPPSSRTISTASHRRSRTCCSWS